MKSIKLVRSKNQAKFLPISGFTALAVGMCFSASATTIPVINNAVLTVEGNAIIDVKSVGSSSTVYMFQVAEQGKTGDCKDSASSSTGGGCRVFTKQRGATSIAAPVTKGGKYQYRVLALDLYGKNPINSGWSHWYDLYSVTDIKPSGVVEVGTPVTFSMVGVYGKAPASLAFSVGDCKFSSFYTCVPQIAGSEPWVVKDKSQGNALARGSLTVSIPKELPPFQYKLISPTGDRNGYYKCDPQCVEFVKKNSGLTGSIGAAYEYATQTIPGFGSLQVNGSKIKPKPGDILVWKSTFNKDIYGHVAIVKSVNMSTGVLVRVAANEAPLPGCGIKEVNMKITGNTSSGFVITSPTNWIFSGWRPKA
jgi:hypothetical protein